MSPVITAFTPSRWAISRASVRSMAELSGRCIRSSAAAIWVGENTVTVRDWVRSTRSASPAATPRVESRVRLVISARSTGSRASSTPCATRDLPGISPAKYPPRSTVRASAPAPRSTVCLRRRGTGVKAPLESALSRCRTRSAESGRKSRSFSRHCIRRAASSGGQSGRPSVTSAGFSVRCAASSSCGVRSANGAFPVSIS